MINLIRFFDCVFDDKRIATKRLVIFGADHLERLIANNVAGKYDLLITATTLRLQNMYNEHDDLDYDIVLQKGSTIAINLTTKNIRKDISIAEGKIISTFPDNPIVYNEFFTNGLVPWHNASRDEMTHLLTKFNKAIANYTADLDAPFIQKWADYKTNYIALHTIQTSKKAIVSGDRDSLESQRRNLENQLMDNLYDLGKEYKRKPGKCHIFFNQSLLFVRHHITDEKETFEGELMSGDTLVLTDSFENETLFRVTNKGDFSFMLCFSDSETESCTVGMVIDKGETKEITAHDLNSDNKKFVKLTNANLEEKCIYEVIKFI